MVALQEFLLQNMRVPVNPGRLTGMSTDTLVLNSPRSIIDSLVLNCYIKLFSSKI